MSDFVLFRAARIYSRIPLIISLCAASLFSSPILGREVVRPWRIQDSIAVRYYSNDLEQPSLLVRLGTPANPFVHSPDGKHFLFVSHFGDLESDANIYDIHVFSSDSVQRALRGRAKTVRPLRILRHRSTSSEGPAVQDFKWSDDGGELTYLGTSDNDHLDVWRFTTADGLVAKMTHSKDGVAWYEYRDGTVIYRARSSNVPEPTISYPVEAVVLDVNGAVDVPAARALGRASSASFISISGTSSVEVPGLRVSKAWIAPAGQKAVVLVTTAKGAEFLLLDLMSPATKPIFRLPISRKNYVRTSAFWSADSKNVVLVNATNVPGVEPDAPVVVAYSEAGEWKVLERLEDVSSLEWNQKTSKLVVARAAGGERTSYALVSNRWIASEVEVPLRPSETANVRFTLAIKQNSNVPPSVVASLGGREVTLSAPDNALKNVAIAPMETFHWRDENGKELSAGLILPRGFRRGTSVPLVIQAHVYRAEMFLPDGPATSAFSAQALAANGFSVIQLDTISLMSGFAQTEGPNVVRRIDGLVRALREQSVLTPAKVGLVGFSRSGYQVHYLISHPGEVHVSAAAITDAWTGSYPAYLDWSAKPITPSFWKPAGRFWENKETWLEHEITFNIDRINTPVLFSEHTGGRYFQQWDYSTESLEIMGGYRANGKPFEYLYFPAGAHQLVRPKERLALMSAVVDWMRFWLLDEEDPDSGKADQYRRWRALRSSTRDQDGTE